jgi:hypothetical protein
LTFSDLAADPNTSRPDRVVEELELTAPMQSVRLKYAPKRHYFSLQYRGGSRPCLFNSAFDFDGDTISLIDGSTLPAGSIVASYDVATPA